MTAKSFTLVELLVVISIIAILASMLLPALNKARNRAKAIQCLGNLKSCGQGMIMYADDSSGIMPVTYYGLHSTFHSTNIVSAPWSRYLYVFEYIKNKKVFRCPSWNRVKSTSSWYYLTYGVVCDNEYVYFADVDEKLVFLNTKKVKSASEVCNLVDSVYAVDYTQSYRVRVKAWPDYRNAHMRHSGKANFLTIDGHAESGGIKRLQAVGFVSAAGIVPSNVIK